MGRWMKCIALLLALTGCAGCRGEADKDKNKNLDRPKPAEPGKALKAAKLQMMGQVGRAS